MVVEPWISAINSIPIVVLIPSLYFSIGGGFTADVFISFVFAVFTMIMNTHAGVKYTSNALAEVGRTFGATEAQYISKILLPASMPDIVAGMRIAAGRSSSRCNHGGSIARRKPWPRRIHDDFSRYTQHSSNDGYRRTCCSGRDPLPSGS